MPGGNFYLKKSFPGFLVRNCRLRVSAVFSSCRISPRTPRRRRFFLPARGAQTAAAARRSQFAAPRTRPSPRTPTSGRGRTSSGRMVLSIRRQAFVAFAGSMNEAGLTPISSQLLHLRRGQHVEQHSQQADADRPTHRAHKLNAAGDDAALLPRHMMLGREQARHRYGAEAQAAEHQHARPKSSRWRAVPHKLRG